MSKSLCLSGIALMLLWGAAARAADDDESTKLEAGPAKVQVQPGSVDVEVQRAEAPGRPVRVQVQTRKGPGLGVQVQAGPVDVMVGKALGVAPEPIRLGDYWLGVQCRFVGEALRAQLGLAEDEGILVEQVVAESPAAKAGIEPHDVLLSAGEKPLKSIQDLIDEVEKTKEKELAIELVRGGQKQTVTVTPAKRPEEALAEDEFPMVPGPGGFSRVENLLHRVWPGDLTRPFRLHFFHPGTILPPGAPVHPPMPGNLTVSITRQGDKPAKIVVEREDERWELTEEELDKLPEDVRPHVERMLGPIGPGPEGDFRHFDFIPDPNLPVPGQPEAQIKERRKFAPVDPPLKGRLEKRLEKRMEEMNERLEKLRETIEGLRKSAPQGEEAPEEEAEKT